MQKLIDTLKSFGIEIPEDKQADVKKALSENYKNAKEVAKTLSKVEGERDDWKVRAETAEETLKSFDGIDPANIKSELETWKQKAADAEKEFNAKIYDRDFSDALKAALDDVKFSSEAAKKSVMADIKEAGLKLKDGKILGLNDLIEQMKQSDASAFVDESQQQAQQNQARFTTHVGQQQTPGTVTATRKAPGSGFSLNLEGAYLGDLASSGSDMRRNHAVLALFAMAEASGHEPDVALNIDKRIPVGAGMAGGSADAAATILALNTLWDLDWPIERLQEVAATLGADMPFCLTGGYARGTGFGERIEQLDDDGDIVRDLTERGFTGHLLVGAYRAELRTPEVYATFDQIGAGDGDENHLQKAAVSLHPRSGQAIEEALRAGASQAFVSGSGPSVIAFVPTEDAADAVQRAWQDSRCVDRIIATNAPARPIVHITA